MTLKKKSEWNWQFLQPAWTLSPGSWKRNLLSYKVVPWQVLSKINKIQRICKRWLRWTPTLYCDVLSTYPWLGCLGGHRWLDTPSFQPLKHLGLNQTYMVIQTNFCLIQSIVVDVSVSFPFLRVLLAQDSLCVWLVTGLVLTTPAYCVCAAAAVLTSEGPPHLHWDIRQL